MNMPIFMLSFGVPIRFSIKRSIRLSMALGDRVIMLVPTWHGESTTMAGDGEFPTICGTGTEDYFCGSYDFENIREKRYQEYNTPYAGVPQIIRPDGLYSSQQRFSMYRWHIMDPIRFKKDLIVTIQALGWRSDGRYLPLQDDIASVAFWYQTLPTAPFPRLPDRDYLEII